MSILRMKNAYFVLLLAFVAVLSGCTSKIPGVPFDDPYANYCVTTRYIQAYHDTVKWSSYDYGPYKKRSAGGGRNLCGLTKFHTLYIKWETKEGILREEHVDIKPLIKELNRTQKVGKGGINGQPDLRIKIINQTLWLEYIIMTLKGRNVVYSLYSSNKNGD